jgi:Flp pilus assembly protein TadB
MEEENRWTGENRRVSKQGLDQLEIEIHAEKVRVWVDGASQFLSDKDNRAALEAMIEHILDGWFKTRAKTALAAFGLTALGSMILAGLVWLGWKGWGGK